VNKVDINKLSKSELEVKLTENQEALMNFRFQKVLQQLEKPQAIRSTKREIAQIKTVIRELDLGIRGKESK
jgi:large subunit ribosomal protein L29